MTESDHTTDDFTIPLRAAVAAVMNVSDMTIGRNETYAVRFRGQLTLDSVEAYDRMAVAFRTHNFTPLFRNDSGQHVILAVPE